MTAQVIRRDQLNNIFFYQKVARQMLIKFRLLLPCILSIITIVFIFFIALFDDSVGAE